MRDELRLASRFLSYHGIYVRIMVRRTLEDNRQAQIEVDVDGDVRTKVHIGRHDHSLRSEDLRDMALMFLDAAFELEQGNDASFERGDSPQLGMKEGATQGRKGRDLKKDPLLQKAFEVWEKQERKSRDFSVESYEKERQEWKNLKTDREKFRERLLQDTIDSDLDLVGRRYVVLARILGHAEDQITPVREELRATLAGKISAHDEARIERLLQEFDKNPDPLFSGEDADEKADDENGDESKYG